MNQTPLMTPRVLIPFTVATLIWGSTWLVIRDQLGVVPPSWSVAYRFVLASAAMFVWARVTGADLRLDRQGHLFALIFGAAQFVLNFNFVYRAEDHITSGLVAVVFALLLVPNALLSRLFLGNRVSPRFVVGSVVALIGVALLIAQQARVDRSSGWDTILGVGLTILGVLSASAANVMQATKQARALPMATLLAWGMLWGALIDAVIAFATSGWPVVEPRWTYAFGTVYLAVFASAIAFTAYFGVIREIGPARAAYSSVITPVIAMILSTLFEGYRWTWLAAGGGLLAAIGLLIALSGRRFEPSGDQPAR